MQRITYSIRTESGENFDFDIELPDPLAVCAIHRKGRENDVNASWTRLGKNQCRKCPLDEESHRECPYAAAIAPVCAAFEKHLSFEKVSVSIHDGERSSQHSASLQEAIASMFELLTFTCGCPILEKLRPLALKHTPFSNSEAVALRLSSLYLVTQFRLRGEGKKVDWEMHELINDLDRIQRVFLGFSQRLRDGLHGKDAPINGLIALDCYIGYARFAIEEFKLVGIHADRPWLGDSNG